MAFGFNPHHKEEYLLGNLTSIQFLVITSRAAEKLEWTVSNISRSGFNAATDSFLGSRFQYITVSIEGDKAILTSEAGGGELYDWGRNKRNINSFIESIEQLKIAIPVEELAIKCQELEQRFSETTQDVTTTKSEKEKFRFISFFKPSGNFFITPIIVDINVLLFIIMILTGVNVIMPDNASLLKWGANFAPYTMNGEWWRLLTSMFLHIGIIHLLMNMYAFLYIGLLLEPYLGRLKFASAYVFTGLISSASSIWWHGEMISAGASGAIFGMYGVFLAMLTTNIIEKSARKALLTSIAVFVVYNLANGMKAGIDNAAHIGGLLSGLVVGYAFIPSLKKPENVNLAYILIFLLGLGTAGTIYVLAHKAPDDTVVYQNIMTKYFENEQKSLDVYRRINSLSTDSIHYKAKAGLDLWKENAKLIDSAAKLRLPDNMHDVVNALKRYTAFRCESYLLLTDVDLKDTAKTAQIRSYNNQITGLIDSLKAQQDKKE